MGVVECAKHELVEPFHVLWERDGMCILGLQYR